MVQKDILAGCIICFLWCRKQNAPLGFIKTRTKKAKTKKTKTKKTKTKKTKAKMKRQIKKNKDKKKKTKLLIYNRNANSQRAMLAGMSKLSLVVLDNDDDDEENNSNNTD